MPRKFLSEYQDGDTVEEVFLLAEKALRANRNAQLFLLATLRDKSGSIAGLQWNVTEEGLAHIKSGDYVRVRGKIQLFQGGLQMIVAQIALADDTELDPADFLPEANQDASRHLERMRELLTDITNPYLAALVAAYWDDAEFVERFLATPAGVRAHHAYHGGLVEHVLNILEMGARIVDLFPALDKDLLLTGIFLHDLGKTREMVFDNSFIYSDEGQLLGHLLIGCEMLSDKVRAAEQILGQEFPSELVWQLKHMILSHHGTIEYGAAKLPMTPEAIALHHLDALDAKVHEFRKAIDEDLNGESRWTPFSPRLQRKIYKGPAPKE